MLLRASSLRGVAADVSAGCIWRPAVQPRPAVAAHRRLCIRAVLPGSPVEKPALKKDAPSSLAFLAAPAFSLLLSLPALPAIAAEMASCPPCDSAISPFVAALAVAAGGIAVVGSVAGGLVARQRKAELTDVVNKLRLLNDALKKQALNRQKQAVLDKAASEACPVEASPMNQRLNIARELLQTNPQASLQAFIGALAVAKLDKSDTGVRKALRGCAAARERLGDLPGALSDMKLVLEMCTNQSESSSVEVEALGKIADLYAELNQFDNAAKYYDLLLAKDGYSETASVSAR